MDLGIKGKRALVTAAGRGIGRAIALCLAREGVRVAVAARTASDVKAVVDEMGGENKGHLGQVIDLAQGGGPQQAVDYLKQKNFGTVDILINNVGGTVNITDPFCSMDDWKKVFRVNFDVAVELNRLLVPPMQEQKWGRVVQISSISSMENQGPVTYCAAKAALTAYTRSFGGVVASGGVVVSAVLPGAVFTENGYWDEAQKKKPDHVRKFLEERQRIGRFGKTEEIANLVVYLSSALASFNTGSIIPVDGGQGRGYFGQ